ncbi:MULTISPECIES: anhydro-N-acetylmuramic acid kinase [Chryseobacterium]|uniref:Anhydro-N-acetylmuramic acid kinase n=1 Tax=Chryseobacterium camelliae TaxID=1265445 RepID=A0ABU0TIU8_9FLAO|nr:MULTISPECIES: anhydro-N-acetylmuramic acid kinase [Chryseobacterium]MDT3409151.1 anhydro-N-acetylmuramic acid kinase [Pseudacidovorax intermedius]MDQ1096990.1 anhydro-N-acetylmuramic acid kinase [Chryseobacterium camelliae]MDQ1100930.1 anhydro-N-acetylmuramic acid kinase [Chryseobacterium sp. SORGH_AS_1048]MDR6084372.1 anhydro-N-acetylmuramic acid kinase [Chryseobacterium sp. SORGH_AS_0909]MDR6132643.1 anhydro-N-acetylmuramic acid kinase [Chryseobacterium sp. SORGH_AS_1175]
MIFQAIGLMSGTSLDGLDICFAEFEKAGTTWTFRILQAETVAYSEDWENKLRNAIQLSSEDLLELHSEYGFYLGKKAKEFIDKHQLENISLIASHGHTVFHQPQKRFTLQIGDGRAIKLETGLPVIYDFRTQDVLMKGNGAPLVPIGDELLFSGYDACLNLGGFSNISLSSEGKRIAFDIAPVNIVLNHLAQQLHKSFDENGALAERGKVDENLLKKLNALEFYHQQHPKSLGIEWCHQHIFPTFGNMEITDALATFTEHAAQQIAHVINTNNIKDILVTGGGAYNTFLMDKIKAKTKAEVIIPEKGIIDYKEALIFAFMGVLKMINEVNVLSSATGSRSDHCSGLMA